MQVVATRVVAAEVVEVRLATAAAAAAAAAAAVHAWLGPVVYSWF
jgi:hypothetical protein